jgi:hypothetical protein
LRVHVEHITPVYLLIALWVDAGTCKLAREDFMLWCIGDCTNLCGVGMKSRVETEEQQAAM